MSDESNRPSVSRRLQVNIIGGSAYSATGGIQAVNRLLVRELGREGLLRKAYFLWDDEESATAEGRELSAAGRVNFYGLNRRQFARALLGDAYLRPDDLWLCTHVNYAAIGLVTSRLRSRQFAVMLHAAELDEAFTTIKRHALRHAGLVIAVSEFTKKKAIRLGVKTTRIRVLHNAVDDPLAGGAAPARTGAGSPTVLFVGRMDERYKGQMELLDAMAILRSRLPDLHLTFVGGGRTLGEWKREAERRQLSGVVRFTGRISDEEIARAYRDAMIFAMPSENEGFGLVYAEAMAHGLPCIGSDRDAAREVIAHGETGWCVPAGNSVALADAIYSLARDPALRERMGAAGRARYLANFAIEHYRERLRALMDTWLAAAA